MGIRVLFMQSQAFFGADSAIHARMMRYFDRRQAEVHVACTTERHADPALHPETHLRRIPDIHIRPTDFGPSVFGTSLRQRARLATTVPRSAVDLLGLAAYIRRHRIDIIHCTEKPRDALYGVLLGRLTGAKSIVHMHVGYEDWLSPSVKWALRHADGIVGCSQFVAQTIKDGGFPPQRVFAVGNSLDDLERWDPTTDGRPLRRELGIPQGAPVLGLVARMYKWKGHSDLLAAAARLKPEFPDLRVLYVGEDDPRAHPGGGSYRAQLEEQARRAGMAENVVFTGFRKDVAAVMATFDVYAMPSWEEPWGMVYLEAMAMERPVVAWRSGGVPEIVVEGQTGSLVERGDVAGLAGALATMLRDPALRRRYGVAGRRRVAEVLTPQRMCQEMLDVYRTTLEAPARRRRGALAGAL